MGRKLAELATASWQAPTGARLARRDPRGRGTPGTFPVGLGVLFAALGSPETDAFAVHQYGVASMILSAALRLMRVDHLDTQAILFEVDAAAADAYAADPRRRARRHGRLRAA